MVPPVLRAIGLSGPVMWLLLFGMVFSGFFGGYYASKPAFPEDHTELYEPDPDECGELEELPWVDVEDPEELCDSDQPVWFVDRFVEGLVKLYWGAYDVGEAVG